jgi:hypothetical protein
MTPSKKTLAISLRGGVRQSLKNKAIYTQFLSESSRAIAPYALGNWGGFLGGS